MRHPDLAAQAFAEEASRRTSTRVQTYLHPNTPITTVLHPRVDYPVQVDFGPVTDPNHIVVGCGLAQARDLRDQLSHLILAAELREDGAA